MVNQKRFLEREIAKRWHHFDVYDLLCEDWGRVNDVISRFQSLLQPKNVNFSFILFFFIFFSIKVIVDLFIYIYLLIF